MVRKKRNQGFTLTEIVILLAVVGIIISAILPLFLNVITVNKNAEYYSKAYKILDSKIENVRNLPFDSVANENFNIPELPQGAGTLSISNVVDGEPQADIKEITVTIRWNFKKQSQVNAVTYLAKGGLKR